MNLGLGRTRVERSTGRRSKARLGTHTSGVHAPACPSPPQGPAGKATQRAPAIPTAERSGPPGTGPGRGGERRQQEKDEEQAAGRRAGRHRAGGAAAGAAGGAGQAAARQGRPPGAAAGRLHGSSLPGAGPSDPRERRAGLRGGCGRSRSRRLGAHAAAAGRGQGLGSRGRRRALLDSFRLSGSGPQRGSPPLRQLGASPSGCTLPVAGAAAPVTAGVAAGPEDAEEARAGASGAGTRGAGAKVGDAQRGTAPHPPGARPNGVSGADADALADADAVACMGRAAHARLREPRGGVGRGGCRVMQHPRQHQKRWWHLQRWG